MAIFHLNESNISRSDGRSAVACAAYRACEKLEDQTFGKTQDYTRKKGLEYKSVYAPEHTNEKLLDRQTLWNEVEKKEFNANGSMKANARLAKEYTCALPHELTDQERIKIVDDFCKDFVKKHNVIVDACIHAPHDYDDETNNKNHHVHIMFTTRVVNEQGELGKKQRAFNDNGPEILKDSRATFANVVNVALEAAGLEERIDHRSYKDQGFSFLEPTAHEGHEVTALRRKGIDTEISLKNDEIKAKNLVAAREYQQVIRGLDQEIFVPSRLEDQIAELEKELRLTEEEEHELLANLADLEHEEQLQAQQAQEINLAYEKFIEQQEQYIDFSKRFYAKGAHATKQIESLDKQLEKSEKWLSKLSKQDGVYYLHGTFYDDYHHKPVDVRTPHFFTTSYETGVKKEEVLKQYRKDVAKLFDDFDIEATVVELKQNAKKLEETGIDLPIPKPTFMQRIRAEYVHSFDTLDNFTTDMKPVFDEYRAELSHAEKEEREKVKRKKDEEQLKQSMEAHKRKKDEELALEMQRRNDASELVKRQRLAAQMQPRENLEKEHNNNNDYGPSI